jgi:outer membrane protein, multidrug efflux system
MTIQKIELARAGVRFQNGNNRPDLVAGAGMGARRFGRYTTDGVGNYDTNLSPDINSRQRIPDPFVPDFLMGVSSSWEIDLWGKLRSQRESAMARLLASEQSKNLLITSLVSEISSAYFEILILDNELRFVEENIDLQQKALEVIQIMKQSGQSNELAVELSSAQLLASKALKIEVQQLIIELGRALSTTSFKSKSSLV